jgi:hypothetical protein
MRFFHGRSLRNVALATAGRAYPFHLVLGLEEDRPTFYDSPITLRALHDALQMVLAADSYPDRYSLIEEREINNFERTLGRLLEEPQAADFRDLVRIIRLE